MEQNKVRRMPIVFLALVFLMFSACRLPSLLTQESAVTVMGIVQQAEHSDVVSARVVLSQGKHVVEEIVPVIYNEFQATIKVPVGQWELTVLLIDANGMVKFQNTAKTIQVALGEPSIVDLVLRPADSSIHVTIDLENYIFRDLALRARIHFNDTIHEIVRPTATSPFTAFLKLAPGSYEFKIELYTDSFRIGDKLGPGVWEVIHIAANEEVFIHWSPILENLQITGRVETLLPAPTNLSITLQTEGVFLFWDPLPDREVAGYFLYSQNSILDRYQLLSPLPIEDTSFLHHVSFDDLPSEIRYMVAAISRSGLVGYYSDPQLPQP